ncbi:MAG: hypothetical protein V1744_07570 [Candidatus Altiarchaeota archaeon]
MYKKNYMTWSEQEIWEHIKDKEIIDHELVKQIFPEMTENKTNKLLHNLYAKRYLSRARKDLYYNPQKLGAYNKLAFRINEGYLGLNSALRYHNLIEYEDFTIFVMTRDYRKNVTLNGTQYDIKFIPLNNLFSGFERKDDIYVSSVEKTIFDCFLKPGYVGFDNITKAVYDATMDWDKFIGFFKLSDNSALCQRTGYVLELMEGVTSINIPARVLEHLSERVKTRVKLTPSGGKTTFNRRWMMQDNIGEKNILSWWR